MPPKRAASVRISSGAWLMLLDDHSPSSTPAMDSRARSSISLPNDDETDLNRGSQDQPVPGHAARSRPSPSSNGCHASEGLDIDSAYHPAT